MTDHVNRGLIVINPHNGGESTQSRERTIIVTGVARGGTSMLAQMLNRLGLFLGDTCDGVVVEDTEILYALRTANLDRLECLIENRNERFAKWGFKVPNLHDLLAPVEERRFRNPCFIVIFRDPLAIARRNELSMLQHFAQALREASE